MSSGLFCLFDYRKRILLRSKPVPFLDNWQKQTKGDKLHANLLSFIDFTEIPRYGDAGTVGNHLKSVKASPWIYPFMIFSLSLPLITPIIVLGILFILISVYKSVLRRKQRRSPFTDMALLRLPGHSLKGKIEELSEQLNEYIIFALSPP